MTTATDYTEAAIACSNLGAACLETGATTEAMWWARWAVQCLTTVLDTETSTTAHAVSKDMVPPTDHLYSPRCTPQPRTDSKSPTKTWSQPSGTYYVYSRPLQLSRTLNYCLLEKKDVQFQALGLIITFNLALAYHRSGVESHKDGLLCHAKQVYISLLELVNKQVRQSVDAAAGPFVFLQCVIRNNLACLYYEHCEYEACESHFRIMYRTMMSHGGFLAPECPSDVQLSEEEAREMLLNGKMSRRQLFAQAA